MTDTLIELSRRQFERAYADVCAGGSESLYDAVEAGVAAVVRFIQQQQREIPVSENEVERVAKALHNTCAEFDCPKGKIPVYELNKNKEGWRAMAKAAIVVMFPPVRESGEEMVPKWALDSQIEICNELRTRCERLEGKPLVEGMRPVDPKDLEPFISERRDKVIPEVEKTLRSRVEAAETSRHKVLSKIEDGIAS